MALPDSQPPGESTTRVPVASVVAMVGKGMTAREILEVFPELEPKDIRLALLKAAEVVRDMNASLRTGDPVGETIRKAQQSSGLTEDEAMALAVSETKAARREQAARRK